MPRALQQVSQVRYSMLSSIVILLVLLLILNGWLYFQQPGMIFFPQRTLEATPADWGLDYESVSLQTEDGLRLHGWFIPQSGSDQVVLFFHGNAGNISHRGDTVAIFHRLGLNVFIIDYRGYGQSEGTPSEAGLARDAIAAWAYLQQTRGYDQNQIIIFGRSLGGSVATRLAASVQPGALIVESTFSSARDMANRIFPLISHLIMLRYQFDTIHYIEQITCPVLIIHSEEDEIIPFQFGQALYQAARVPKSFLKIHGDHNSGFIQSQPDYEQGLNKFITRQPGH
jgi:fermentation-respiration switch protein FrsA (DUF1100 family)